MDVSAPSNFSAKSDQGGKMRSGTILICVAAVAAVFAGQALAVDTPTNDGITAKWMIEKERAWANMACGGEWVATEILADDFQGTAPKGMRYGKPKSAPTYDPKTQWSTDCRLDEADVRFFSPDVAVVYGAESKTVALPDAKHERRCLVWSDMWLRRKGRWQIIAVQDNRVECPTK
ncbi:nuclear transport factor 2 family protein [Rhodanobacter sp. MP1X3]|uniref:DUF4440 domain-containing protein n=1 Tax=Rhodanobacter sp. MP1X3 TaxID=2723086 RepID=UPI00161B3F24|nr:hypothetical protein [Rhodanobacter sp. MP1X3]